MNDLATISPEFDVLIVGAGPVGLLLANTLGAAALRVCAIEQLTDLIDYPRGVGMDDECLRAIQATGLLEAVLPHTSPYQTMRFYTARGRCFASIEPKTDEFGWPRRNAFIQPLTDRAFADGLARFPNVQLRFATTLTHLTQSTDQVQATVTGPDGTAQILAARYAIGCDGGRSAVRKTLDIAFEGKTAPNRWVVVDLLRDPIGIPGVQFHCDPARPYVSIALPHGIRRLEFLLHPGEAENDTVPEETLAAILVRLGLDPARTERIRTRIYTHNGRLARAFRGGRVLLAGDAAHIMPVWQGQGYNSGIRDATNLGWKLAMVLHGAAAPALLDSYEAERRDHARAMISLSETAGRIFAPAWRLTAALRDALTLALNLVPPIKRYFLEMRFKPMPRYRGGAIYLPPGTARSPVGTMFIQPRVDTATAANIRLDDAIGSHFAVLAWGTEPADTSNILARLGARCFRIVPPNQFAYEQARQPEYALLADRDFRLKAWFEQHGVSVVVLRPDRFIAAACLPASLPQHLAGLARAMHLTEQNEVLPALHPQ